MRLHPVARPSLRARAVLAVASLRPGTALALDAEVTSDTAAQFYDVRSPTGETTVLKRRRLTTTLGARRLQPPRRAGGRPHARRTSPSARASATTPTTASPATRPTPTNFGSVRPRASSERPVDLMYAYVEGRRFLNGWLGFKLGRQYVTDALGWWSFDGGEVERHDAVLRQGRGLRRARGARRACRSAPRASRPTASGAATARASTRRSTRVPAGATSRRPSAPRSSPRASRGSTGASRTAASTTPGASNVTEFASGLYPPAVYDGARISSERLGYAIDATSRSSAARRPASSTTSTAAR